MIKHKTTTFDVQIPNLEGDGISETIPVEVTVYVDPETGEEVLTAESVELIEKTQARHMGLLSPLEIKSLRERLDLTQKEMSELLQIGEKSYTRWESGRARPSRSINLLLCALRDGRMDVGYLRALRNPDRDWASLFERSEEFTNLGWEHVFKIRIGHETVLGCARQTHLFDDRREFSSKILSLIDRAVKPEESVTVPRLTAPRASYDFHPEEETESGSA